MKFFRTFSRAFPPCLILTFGLICLQMDETESFFVDLQEPVSGARLDRAWEFVTDPINWPFFMIKTVFTVS